MKKLPAIVDGRFKLFERYDIHEINIREALLVYSIHALHACHAILIYLACAFSGVPNHCYPADVFKRNKIHSVLDWHHSNLRRGAVTYTLAVLLGILPNPQAAAEAEKLVSRSLSKIDSVWLQDNETFLLGGNQPSIADLSLVCEIMQLEVLNEKDRTRLLGPHKKVQQWIENIRNATQPHFDEVHKILMKAQEKHQNQRLKAANNGGRSDMEKPSHSRM